MEKITPIFSYFCKDGHETEIFYHTRVGITDKTSCSRCHRDAKRSLVYAVAPYGTVKFHDKTLADASEAAGRPVTSGRQMDEMAKSGELRQITNPSQRHAGWRTAAKEKRMARLKKYKQQGLA